MNGDTPREWDKRIAVLLGWKWFEATIIDETSKYKNQTSIYLLPPTKLEGTLFENYYDLEEIEEPVEKPKYWDGCEADGWHVPYFTTVPSDAQIVIKDILEKGWMLTRIDYKSKRPLPAYPSQHRAQIITKSNPEGMFEYWGCDDHLPYLALGIAYVNACEGEKK